MDTHFIGIPNGVVMLWAKLDFAYLIHDQASH